MKMNKVELVNAIFDKTDGNIKKKDITAVLEAFEKSVIETVADGTTVILDGFVKFESRHRPARPRYNPGTKSMQMSEAKNSPAVQPLTRFRRAVAGG